MTPATKHNFFKSINPPPTPICYNSCQLFHFLMHFGSLYCSLIWVHSVSLRSSLIWVHSVCLRSSLIWVHSVCRCGNFFLSGILIYAADVISRQHFQDKKILTRSGLRYLHSVASLVKVFRNAFLNIYSRCNK